MTISWIPKLQKDDEPLYLAITKALAGDISEGRLMPDYRLPTQRELSHFLGVAIGTITRAYSEAEERGLIRSEGRRGTFVGESRKDRSVLSKLIESGDQAIDLSKNHPVYSEDPDLTFALNQIIRRKKIQHLLQYPPSPGLLQHRIAGADWILRLGMKADPDSIVITSGAQHALMVIFSAITRRGDIILSEAYTYPGVKAIAELFGLQLLGVSLDGEGMIPEALESLCRHRKVRAIYCNPTLQNPTNTVCSLSRRQEIASIAEKYNIAIVEDEILRPLVSDAPPFISSIAPERSYLVMSASKVIAAGLRTGFILAPPGSSQKIIDSLQTSTLCVPSVTAEILSYWIEKGTTEKIIKRRQREHEYRQQLGKNILSGYPNNTERSSCYIWYQLPDNWTAMEFAVEAQRRGVAVSPAEVFAVDRKTSNNAVRISIGSAQNREILKTGLEILANILDTSSRHDSATV